MASIKLLLENASAALKETSESARLDAELILCFVLSRTRIALISSLYEEIAEDLVFKFQELIERRMQHEPIAYITGKKEFFGLDFVVNKNVLIPRPETELLVELAIEAAKKEVGTIRLLDLGTGSACISIAIAHELEKLKLKFNILALDKEVAALEVAAINIRQHRFENSIKLLRSDWFSALNEKSDSFNIIISNPPYIAKEDLDVSASTAHEPKSALYAGISGLECLAEIIKGSKKFLTTGGSLVCEMGAGQRSALQNVVLEGQQIEFYKDLSGLDRACIIRK